MTTLPMSVVPRHDNPALALVHGNVFAMHVGDIINFARCDHPTKTRWRFRDCCGPVTAVEVEARGTAREYDFTAIGEGDGEIVFVEEITGRTERYPVSVIRAR